MKLFVGMYNSDGYMAMCMCSSKGEEKNILYIQFSEAKQWRSKAAKKNWNET